MAKGILRYGAYVPMRRLQRKAMVAANSWFNGSLKSQGKGERAMANWDEDSVTMAVAAARDCLGDFDRDQLSAVHLASTTLPFADRLNAGIVAGALNLAEGVGGHDHSASQRAGLSALADALNAGGGPILVTAAEKRRTKAASPLELSSGDGAAALLVGEGDVIAELVAHATRTVDFVDHYRGDGVAYDYTWEERWIRDEGYNKIVPATLKDLFATAGVTGADIAHFVMPCTLAKVAGPIARKAGIAESALRDNLAMVCGDTGAAHALVMFAHALESAKAGELILVVAFGQGCDALLFRATDRIGAVTPARGVSGFLARRREETNYQKFLAFNDTIEMERGMRSELDKATALSSLYRNRNTITGFVGGKCNVCGTLQFPKTNICVNPNCNAFHSQEPQPFSDLEGRIMSYTADNLTYSADPPACYGMVQFDAGGRVMIDFTDVTPDDIDVGRKMDMVFRIKDYDGQRGFTRYFWKATPAADAAQQGG
ncbi:MAG TPA: OB-fold domain-containing protein [Beijerinckiaceae bacterium]|nr:hydroxymethylglutaryl-CoA synthase family protein [Rhodoblastus sp.]MCB1523816.1 hydroxymethylglutaryl-CoA synthase family protein [Rhodoblastus sp.]MCC0000458.1 hydroxymethylglutaryl-CoA synthase family protein [Methylobacteriaceae bacterium]HRY03418.1 OB-fold domain-containing protein [Beijerinckiaceae bacterium]